MAKFTWEPLQGSVGTSAAWAIKEEPILSPKAAMDEACGPRNIIPFASNASGSSGISDACPQPGQTASTCVISAVWNHSTYA